jgi:hypothetical protein
VRRWEVGSRMTVWAPSRRAGRAPDRSAHGPSAQRRPGMLSARELPGDSTSAAAFYIWIQFSEYSRRRRFVHKYLPGVVRLGLDEGHHGTSEVRDRAGVRGMAGFRNCLMNSAVEPRRDSSGRPPRPATRQALLLPAAVQQPPPPDRAASAGRLFGVQYRGCPGAGRPAGRAERAGHGEGQPGHDEQQHVFHAQDVHEAAWQLHGY